LGLYCRAMERTAITDREEFKRITETLLSPELNYTAIREACSALSELFCKAAAFDTEEEKNQEHISTAAGLAVSPYAAVLCIGDMMRTRNFLQGIKEAVDFKLKRNPSKPVVIFYAGCGPFATLLTPLTTIFSPAQLQMVLMDINPLSLQYLQKIIQHFSAEDYISGIVETDATQYSISEKYQPDILLSETMKPALAKEPQVSVISHLLPQCRNDVILIPERIKVDACLRGNVFNNPDAFQVLQTLFEVDAGTAKGIKNNPGDVPVFGKGMAVEINDKPPQQFSRLVLKTTIKVYGNHVLDFNESSLTIPVPVIDIAAIKKYPARFLFQYQISDNPGFIVREV